MLQFIKSHKTFAAAVIIVVLVVTGLVAFAAHLYVLVVVAFVLLSVVVDNVVRSY